MSGLLIFLALVAAAVLLLAGVLAGWQWLVAVLAVKASVRPFRLAELNQRARRARAAIARRWIMHAVSGYLSLAVRLIATALAVTGALGGGLALARGLGAVGPGAAWLFTGLTMTLVLAAGVAAATVALLLTMADERRRQLAPSWWLRRLLPFDPRAFRPDRCGPQFAALEECVRAAQKRAQQAEVDGIAREAQAALPYVIRLEPDALRLRVDRQLALWPSPADGSAPSSQAHRDAMAVIDGHFEELERDLAAGADPAQARALWYSVILRTLRRRGGPRALHGTLLGLTRAGSAIEVVELANPLDKVIDLTAAREAAPAGLRSAAARPAAGRPPALRPPATARRRNR